MHRVRQSDFTYLITILTKVFLWDVEALKIYEKKNEKTRQNVKNSNKKKTMNKNGQNCQKNYKK